MFSIIETFQLFKGGFAQSTVTYNYKTSSFPSGSGQPVKSAIQLIAHRKFKRIRKLEN